VEDPCRVIVQREASDDAVSTPVDVQWVIMDSHFSKPRFGHSSPSANILFGSVAARLIHHSLMKRIVPCEPLHQDDPYHEYQIHQYLGGFGFFPPFADVAFGCVAALLFHRRCVLQSVSEGE
jgi:hypothetical protein